MNQARAPGGMVHQSLFRVGDESRAPGRVVHQSLFSVGEELRASD